MDGKTKAIVAHITFIGWIIALVLNQSENKDEFASFYIRQTLVLHIIWLVVVWIPIIGWFIMLAAIVLWIISLIGAAGGEQKLIPFIGEQSQDWFKSL